MILVIGGKSIEDVDLHLTLHHILILKDRCGYINDLVIARTKLFAEPNPLCVHFVDVFVIHLYVSARQMLTVSRHRYRASNR